MSARALVRFVICLALAPLMVLTLPNVAGAAIVTSRYGDWVSADRTFALPLMLDPDCSVSVRWEVHPGGSGEEVAALNVANGVCHSRASWDETTIALGFEGLDSNSAPCAASWVGTLTETDATNWYNPASKGTYTFGGVTAANSAWVDCSVTELCWDIYPDNVGRDETVTNDCAPFALGAPPELETSDTCQFGTVTGVRVEAPKFVEGTSSTWLYEFTVFGTGTGAWYVSPFLSAAPVTGNTVPPSTNSTTARSAPMFTVTYTRATADASANVARAFEIYAAHPDWNLSPDATWSTTPPTMADPGKTQGYKGMTQPSKCRWYFGDKMFNIDGTTADDPAGPILGEGEEPTPDDVPPPPPPTPEPDPDSACEFTFSDPSTWAGAGMCAVVGLLGRILDALSGIVKGIVNGIKALFVPSNPNAIKASVNGMKDSFDGKFPFSIAQEVQTLSGGIGTGCPNWRVKVGADFDESAICDSSFTAAIRGARGFILGGMLALAFWPLMRGVFYASVPVLKPTPVGGK